MDTRQLRYFVAIVESGSLSEASRRLHIVQSALSQRLKDLEEQLGVELFLRGRNGLAVTQAGSELYERATLILKQIEAAGTAVREQAGIAQGHVAIGLLRTVAPLVAGPLFLAIREELPGVTAELVVGYSAELRGRLHTSKLDLAMQVLSPKETPGQGLFLYQERLCLVGTAKLMPAAHAPLKLAQLAGIPLVLSARQPANQAVIALARAAGVSLDIVGGVEDTSAVLEICLSGAAVSLQPESVATRLASESGLESAILEEPALTRRVVIAHNDSVMKTGAVIASEAILTRILGNLIRPGIGA